MAVAGRRGENNVALFLDVLIQLQAHWRLA
jgi:hypothetical protein